MAMAIFTSSGAEDRCVANFREIHRVVDKPRQHPRHRRRIRPPPSLQFHGRWRRSHRCRGQKNQDGRWRMCHRNVQTPINGRPRLPQSITKTCRHQNTAVGVGFRGPGTSNLDVELQTRRSSNPSSVFEVLPWYLVAPCLCVLLRRGLLCGCPVVRIVSGELIASTGSSGSNVISYTSELPSTLKCRIVCALLKKCRSVGSYTNDPQPSTQPS